MPTQQEIEDALNAILSVESSRNYGLVGPTHPRYGRALGGFQVMETNLRPWLRDAGMPDMSPEDFLRNPEAQRNLFRHRFGMYAQRHGLEGASRAWFAGEGGMNDPNRRDVFGTTVSEYARRFNAQLGRGNQGGPNMGDGGIETTNVNVPDVRNQPEQPNTWSQWLSSPTNRAFLMSAGAQMAQPTWGNAASNFSMALAQGGQAQAETGNRQADEEFRRTQLQSSEVQGELNRRSAERRTVTAAESRLDVAGLRANAMLQRAHMIGLRQPAQQNEFMRTVRSLYSTLMQNNPAAMTDPALQEQLFNQALERAAAAMARNPATQGQVTPGNLEGVVAPPPANQPGPRVIPPAGPGPVTPPPGPSSRENPRPGITNPPPGPSGEIPWETFAASTAGQRILRNPAQRQRLLESRPHWAPQIEAWMAAQGVQ